MEVYGTKPKLFSREWWDYYWYYYKWHTIVIGIIVLTIAYSCVQCATDTKYDLKADYISQYGLSEEQRCALEEMMSGVIDDASGNDKIDSMIVHLDMRESPDPQMTQAMQTKLFLEQGYSESYAFIVTDEYMNWLADAEIFEPISLWAENSISENGTCVSLKDCKYLTDLGIDTEHLYVAVRKMREDDKKKEYEVKQYENGIKFAQYLIG